MLRKLNELVCRKREKAETYLSRRARHLLWNSSEFWWRRSDHEASRAISGISSQNISRIERPHRSSCSISQTRWIVKNQLPIKKWSSLKKVKLLEKSILNLFEKCKGKIGLVLPETSLGATWLLLAMSIARKSAFSANLTKQTCRISNCATFL